MTSLRDLLLERTRVLVEAHRGGDSVAPENSWEALHASAAAAADLIEVDVQTTRDGVAFLRHHYTIDDVYVSTLSWAEVETAYAPAPAPPRLDEVLRWAKDHGVLLALDIKDGFGLETVDFVATVVADRGLIDQVFLMSWNHRALRALKTQDARFLTRAHVRAKLVDVALVAEAAKVDAISLSYDLVSADEVQALQAVDVRVALGELWEPNFALAHELGVDIVIWGSPAEARRGLAALEA